MVLYDSADKGINVKPKHLMYLKMHPFTHNRWGNPIWEIKGEEMIGYFPPLYPDEIFYSICARYYKVLSNNNYEYTAQELFGRKYAGKGLFFPSKLNEFANIVNTSMGSNAIYVTDIIENHTLFPLFRPFISKIHKMRLISSLLTGVPKSYKFLDLLSITTNSKGVVKFCKKCILENRETYGEAYVNRLHQIPGNVFCLKHECVLCKCRIDDYRKNGRVFIIDEIDIDQYDPLQIERSLMQKMYKLSIDINFIMENNLNDFDIGILRKKHVSRLNELGIYKVSEYTNHKQLYEHYLKYYHADFLEYLGFYETDKTYEDWLQNIPYIMNAASPIRHLLFIRLLFGSAKAFFEE